MMSQATKSGSSRSTAALQRERIVARGIAGFSSAGFHATPVTAIADAAGVSPAYVFRLFDGKVGLFVATVDHCYSLVADALARGGEASGSSDPDVILAAMSATYIDLIEDRDLIRLQVHAQSACDVPEIRSAVRRGIALVTREISRVSGADAASVQRMLAYGQLCHLIVQAELWDVHESWAQLVSAGISHPAAYVAAP